MLVSRDENTIVRERLLAQNIVEVATELRMIDVADFIAYIRFENFGNIDNLVNCAAELYFIPNTLRFGQSAEIQSKWSEPPVVVLDMEFKHCDVQMFFRLYLQDKIARLNINYISLRNPTNCAQSNTRIISDALWNARDIKFKCIENQYQSVI
ncbi:MAG: hypothetical protein KTR19_13230 [Hyphomicrobiales bacterium]|nr:hypothetical protein [Hyphomicrobiales bacterium]